RLRRSGGTSRAILGPWFASSLPRRAWARAEFAREANDRDRALSRWGSPRASHPARLLPFESVFGVPFADSPCPSSGRVAQWHNRPVSGEDGSAARPRPTHAQMVPERGLRRGRHWETSPSRPPRRTVAGPVKKGRVGCTGPTAAA